MKIMNLLFIIYSSVADNKDFHTASAEYDQPYLYCTLMQPGDKVRNLFPYINNNKYSCILDNFIIRIF